MLCSRAMPDFQTVVLRVHMYSEKCSKNLAKVLQSMKEVEDYDIDLTEQKVTVMGRVEPKKFAKKLQRKSGRHTELWIDRTERSLSDSRRRSWRLPSVRNSFKRITTVFSDENPDNCSIM